MPGRAGEQPRAQRAAVPFLCVAVLFVCGVAAAIGPSTRAAASPIEPGAIRVVDGDTIAIGATVYRLVGFDAPETGSRARCESERTLGARASFRLRQLVSGGGLTLEPIRCSCPPGTEGTKACNYGRLCARLIARGRDVGDILISEGLARPYVCGTTLCPRRQPWCDERTEENADAPKKPPASNRPSTTAAAFFAGDQHGVASRHHDGVLGR
jgi:endonuclease YncB( thermonuclease family)